MKRRWRARQLVLATKEPDLGTIQTQAVHDRIGVASYATQETQWAAEARGHGKQKVRARSVGAAHPVRHVGHLLPPLVRRKPVVLHRGARRGARVVARGGTQLQALALRRRQVHEGRVARVGRHAQHAAVVARQLGLGGAWRGLAVRKRVAPRPRLRRVATSGRFVLHGAARRCGVEARVVGEPAVVRAEAVHVQEVRHPLPR